jgi:hypothetical protein
MKAWYVHLMPNNFAFRNAFVKHARCNAWQRFTRLTG